jgi:hypothetical protein
MFALICNKNEDIPTQKISQKKDPKGIVFSVRNELRFETKKSEIIERDGFSKGFVDPRITYHDDQTRERFSGNVAARIYFETYEQALRNS